MPLNPAIALEVPTLQLTDPVTRYGRVMAMQSAAQQNALAQRQMQQAEQQAEQQNRLREFLPTLTPENRNQLLQYGESGRQAYESLLKGEKEAREGEKAAADIAASRMKQARDLLPSVNSPEAYANWRNYTLQQLPGLSNIIPQQYSPEVTRNLMLEADKALEQHFVSQNLGGTERVVAMPKYAQGPAQVVPGSEARKGLAPGEAERIRIAAGQLALSQQRLAWEKENPGYELQQTADGNIVGINKRTLQAVPVTLGNTPGEAAPSGQLLKGAPKSKDIAVSEQQAAYNISRVLNAAQEIAKVAEKDPSALAPGATEAAASSVGLSGTANLARSTNRQIVNGAQRDALDAILYLATGAAYNKEQLKGAIEAYMPAYTDSAEYREVKRKRMAKLIESAKVRAGKAWTPDLENALQSLTEPLSAASGKSSKSTRSAKPVAVSADEVDTDNPLLK